MPVAISSSTIARQAFRLMELRPLQTFGESSREAQAATDQYPEALGMQLEAYDWAFARKLYAPALATLPRTEPTDPEFAYTFTLPADLLKIRRVYPAGGYDGIAVHFRLDGRWLRSDQAEILIRGTRRIENEAQMPSDFKLAVACQLAVLLSPEFVTSRTKRAELKDDLRLAFDRAKSSDHTSASPSRMDGLPESTSDDWVDEVTR
ncbi:hypothetical protein [uncultured Salipiger sp.]|uniref:hypothetical protein n=1 Tax=uncultured Salipiger sp. TaxID=499810 RepID=UPI002591C5F7|nr:hypothetical protein [uncultured Salipiger sp.]